MSKQEQFNSPWHPQISFKLPLTPCGDGREQSTRGIRSFCLSGPRRPWQPWASPQTEATSRPWEPRPGTALAEGGLILVEVRLHIKSWARGELRKRGKVLPRRGCRTELCPSRTTGAWRPLIFLLYNDNCVPSGSSEIGDNICVR